VCSAALSLPSEAATYHVAPAGSNENPGTSSRPFRTITWGAEVMDAGDELIVHGGTYYESVTIWAKRGRQKARIAIRAAKGEKAIIDGSKMHPDTNAVVIIGNSGWVELSGFEVRNSATAGILLLSCTDSFVTSNEVHHTDRYGIHAKGTVKRGSSANIHIEGNYVHHAVQNNAARTATEGWTQAVSVMYTDGAVIQDNNVSYNYGEGIDVIASRNVVVSGNELHDNYATNIYLDNAQNTTVNGNFIYTDDAEERFFRDASPAAGITAANEHYEGALPLKGLTITNNIVLWCRSGFVYGDWEAGGGLHDTLVANNTFYASKHAAVLIQDDTHDTTVVANNIFLQTGEREYVRIPGEGVSFRNNAWYGGRPGTKKSGRGDVTDEPGLANPGGGRVADYRLTARSPLRRAGAKINGVRRDYWGTPRTQPFSIGAHEAE
jgi:parallel beta-helix repeat protein